MYTVWGPSKISLAVTSCLKKRYEEEQHIGTQECESANQYNCFLRRKSCPASFDVQRPRKNAPVPGVPRPKFARKAQRPWYSKDLELNNRENRGWGRMELRISVWVVIVTKTKRVVITWPFNIQANNGTRKPKSVKLLYAVSSKSLLRKERETLFTLYDSSRMSACWLVSTGGPAIICILHLGDLYLIWFNALSLVWKYRRQTGHHTSLKYWRTMFLMPCFLNWCKQNFCSEVNCSPHT